MIYAKYKGGGWLPGIPARDLTREEFDRLSDDQKVDLLASGLYEIIQPAKKAPVEKKEV